MRWWCESRPTSASPGWENWILLLLNSIPNALIVEFVTEEGTNLRETVTKQKLRARDGYLTMLDAPGLGMDFDESAVEALRMASSRCDIEGNARGGGVILVRTAPLV
jgi:hypothetical protein